MIVMTIAPRHFLGDPRCSASWFSVLGGKGELTFLPGKVSESVKLDWMGGNELWADEAHSDADKQDKKKKRKKENPGLLKPTALSTRFENCLLRMQMRSYPPLLEAL